MRVYKNMKEVKITNLLSATYVIWFILLLLMVNMIIGVRVISSAIDRNTEVMEREYMIKKQLEQQYHMLEQICVRELTK